jgi:hypothetical protein
MCLMAALSVPRVAAGPTHAHGAATRGSLRSPRQAQAVLTRMSDPWRRFFPGRLRLRQRYGRAEVSPRFRVNGRPPNDPVYDALGRSDFADGKLEVGGLVAEPPRLSPAEGCALPRETRITVGQGRGGWREDMPHSSRHARI